MKSFWVASLAGTLAVLATDASAAAPGGTSPIIVQGERQRAQIDDFVARLKPAQGNSQLGKFLQPICPEVSGLAAPDNQRVAFRMRQVAAAAGVEAEPAGCATNVLVLVVADKSAAMNALRRTRPDLLGELPATEFHRMATDPLGAAAWQVVDQIGTDGMSLANVRIKTGGDPAATTSARAVRSFGSVSRLRELSVPQFLTSIVIVEADVARDVTTTQLADYALMRSLVGTDDRGSAPSQSILNLINADRTGTEAPLSATWWDIALLKSLYSTSNAVEASVQRDAIARSMATELRKTPPRDR